MIGLKVFNSDDLVQNVALSSSHKNFQGKEVHVNKFNFCSPQKNVDIRLKFHFNQRKTAILMTFLKGNNFQFPSRSILQSTLSGNCQSQVNLELYGSELGVIYDFKKKDTPAIHLLLIPNFQKSPNIKVIFGKLIAISDWQ